jgi:hypothetical protein
VIDYAGQLQAVGLVIHGCDASGGVSWSGEPNEELAALVFAALDKPLASAKCQALKTYLGGATDPRWLAYLAARKAPIDNKRDQQVLVDVVKLIVDLFYTATPKVVTEGVFLGFSAAKLQAAKAKIDEIKAVLPYPD